MALMAITRDVSPTVSQCELTHLARTPIDYERAREQHRRYRALLASLGCEVLELPADTAYPDAVFVEDTAVVLDEVAVITNPGAESRRGETAAVAAVLTRYRPLASIMGRATIDGGDVLVLDRALFVGRSLRTNDEGIAALREIVAPHGYSVVPVGVDGCLHLKTAVTRVSRDALLINRSCAEPAKFDGWRLIDVDPKEPFAANALLVGDVVVFPSAFPRTRARLESHGIEVRTVDADELAKAEGGVTCCSVLVG